MKQDAPALAASVNGIENEARQEAAAHTWQFQSVMNRSYFTLAIQLALLTLVIQQFRVENAAFIQLSQIALGGCLIHCLLPHQYRLPFFVVLSLVGIVVITGVVAGLWLIGLGLALIGICHLPVAIGVRIAALMLAAVGLAMLRADWMPSPWPSAIWPILGSMFMFRLCLYVYELRGGEFVASPWRTLAYFFPLPNVVFPLFPVLDYDAFRRTYYNDDERRIYQTGVNWIFRGVVHLLLYRLVYYHIVLEPSEVAGPADSVRFLISNFLLYLRVSGQFHIIVGILRLFGFNLPETHHFYFLASSFNDFWRRINIYWKDFMLKLFYYPSFFTLRKFNSTFAVVLSTFVVFLATWLLHSYQWFWLRGSFPLRWQDALFWGVLGLFVIVNSLREIWYPRRRRLGNTRQTWGDALRIGAQTAGTFAIICVLWSVWTIDTLAEWQQLWSFGETRSTGNMTVTIGLLAAVVGVGAASSEAVLLKHVRVGVSWFRQISNTAPFVIASLLLLYVGGQRSVNSHLGWPVGDALRSAGELRLNSGDAALLERGYYENLMNVDRFNSQLWEIYMRNESDLESWRESRRTMRSVDTFLLRELTPDFQSEWRGQGFSTNQWGMRDKPYTQQKTQGTIRIALLSSSTVMGSGVGDGETFESLIEDRLNNDPRYAGNRHYEILNFAVGGYGPLQQMFVLDQRVFSFQPDAVIYVGQYIDVERVSRHLAQVLEQRVEVPYDFIAKSVRDVGVAEGTPAKIGQAHLRSVEMELLTGAYTWIAQQCRSRNILPIWIYLPDLIEEQPAGDLAAIAERAGFVTVDASDIYGEDERGRLRISDADSHPNREGHRVLAERLYSRLRRLDEERSLGIFTPVPTVRATAPNGGRN